MRSWEHNSAGASVECLGQELKWRWGGLVATGFRHTRGTFAEMTRRRSRSYKFETMLLFKSRSSFSPFLTAALREWSASVSNRSARRCEPGRLQVPLQSREGLTRANRVNRSARPPKWHKVSLSKWSIETVQIPTLRSACRHYGQFILLTSAVYAQENAGQDKGDVWKPACISEETERLDRRKWLELKRKETNCKMANQNTRKCAHIPCLCDVRDGQEYCGDACRDAGGEDVEIACQCDHPTCPLTVRWFVPTSAVDLAG